MKSINNYITEKFKINSKTVKKESKPKEHHNSNNSDLVVEYDGEEYENSIGEDLPIDDYAESAEEAFVMIERDTTEKDKLYILKKLDNNHYQPIYKDLDGYFMKVPNDNYYRIRCDKFHNTHNKETIKDIYKQGYIIVKIKG